MDQRTPSPIDLTRRQFFGRTTLGLGGLLGTAALSRVLGAGAPLGSALPLRPRARRVIYLYMEGGPSHLDLFDWKPVLAARAGEDLRKMPEIYNQQRITGMTSGQSSLPLVPSMFRFTRHDNGGDGAYVSELLPHTAAIVDRLCFVRSVHTDAINHEPGITLMQTGSQIPGRPSFGSWLSYGIGSENSDLPAFVVMISRGVGNMQALSDRLWGSGFLPSQHQGVRFRGGDEAVLFLADPPGVSRDDRRVALELSTALNRAELALSLDPEVEARIQQAEMAFRMQASVPDLTDISNESSETLELYGSDVTKPGTFAANCLLARRLAERGVRFVQLYHRGWDAHGNLPTEIRGQCQQVDRAQAALILDLERRGLLDDTLVIWGGEFGRTAYCQGGYNPKSYGRDHHPRCFTMWFAGGGIRPGTVYGRTDDFGYNIAEHPVHVHDLHATFLHLLGLDHERLTYRFQGRHYRLTDVAGNVVRPILA